MLDGVYVFVVLFI